MGAKSVTRCEKCGGESSVEDTRRKETWYVKRVRGCQSCGHTWSTAEVPLADLRKLKLLDQFVASIT